MRIRLLPVAVLAAALLPAAPAAAKSYDVPAALGSSIDRVKDRSPLPILLPQRLALDTSGRLYGTGSGNSRRWDLTLGGAPNCGANVCMLAFFSAERGGTPAFKHQVRLRGGVTGYFKPLTCGGSCSPPEIQFVRAGVLYTIQAKVPDAKDAGQRRRLVRAANSALRNGPR
jgi:hypothetical protein